MASKNSDFWRLLLCSVLAVSACDHRQTQMNGYLEQGKKAFVAGDKQTARLAFQQAIATVEPDNSEALTQIAEVLSRLGDLESAANLYQTAVAKDAKAVVPRIKLGQILLLAGKVNATEQLAKQALALAPDNQEATLLLAGVLSAQNNTDAAFAKTEQVLAKKPNDLAATLLLATLHAKVGNLAKAVALLRQNLNTDPKHSASRLLLAKLYLQTGDREQAKENLLTLLAMEPKELTHRQRLAAFYVENRQLDQAEQVLREASKELPDERAKLLLVEFLAEKRSPEVAIAELIPMLEQNPEQFLLRNQLAELQMRQRHYDEVEEILQDTINLAGNGSQAVSARNQLAQLYLRAGRVEDVRSLLQANLTQQPHDPDSLLVKAQLALADDNVAEAIAGLRSLLAEHPDHINALKLLSSAHQLNNDGLLAIENLQKVLSLNPKDEAARIELVDLLLKTGNRQAAENQLNELFKLSPDSKDGLEALAKIYLSQQQWPKARQVAQRIQSRYPAEAAGFYLEALSYQAENKFAQSIPLLQTAVRKQPQAVEPLNSLVMAYMALKQADQALALLNETVKKQPEHFFAYNLLGGVYANGKNYDKAADAYQKAISLQPQWPNAYRNLAALRLAQKNPQEAMAVLNKGIDNSNNVNDLVNDLAKIYHSQGEYGRVIALYEKIHRSRPQSLVAANNLVAYVGLYGKDEKSKQLAAGLLPPLIDSNNPYFVDTAAWFVYQQGDWQRAKQILTKAEQLAPGSAIVHYHLGMVYHRLGDNSLAKRYLQKALDFKTEFEGMAEAKAVLKAMEGK